ncbi:glycosyltransferase involved in cell wall biosynthesis [Pseudacidovorax sp. 1753]|uniref:glycosyltransferase family protein n=1 Tax=Pseudacidovorax sp. 1753 TaxID=3156419 RepID=UPI00339483DD
MRRAETIFFFAPICGSKYTDVSAKSATHIAAATNKVLNLCKSVRTQKVSAVVIASPITTSNKEKIFTKPHATFERGIPVFYLRTLTKKGLNRIFAAWGYLFAAKRICTCEGRKSAVFYNFFIEYTLALILLKIMGIPAYLDVEDGPRADEKDFRGFVNRVSYWIISRLTVDRKLVASKKLAEKLKFDDYCVVYGAVSSNLTREKKASGGIKILYGGALMRDTGLDLFLDALNNLSKCTLPSKLTFVVTGFADRDLSNIPFNLTSSNIDVHLKLGCSRQEYLEELKTSFASLALKLPSTEMGSTTYPSKTLEVAAEGLLLISTDVSDVGAVFTSGVNALILEREDPLCLVRAIKSILEQPKRFEEIARAGRDLIMTEHSYQAVGARLCRFLS